MVKTPNERESNLLIEKEILEGKVKTLEKIIENIKDLVKEFPETMYYHGVAIGMGYEHYTTGSINGWLKKLKKFFEGKELVK